MAGTSTKVKTTTKGCPDELKVTRYDLKITLLEPMLGTVPMNPEVYKDFIESKKPEDEQDVEHTTVEAREERGWTGFHRDKDGIFLYNYMIKGFLKASANILKEQIGLPAAKSKVNNHVRVTPRRIRIEPYATKSAEELAEELGTGDKTCGVKNGMAVLERPLQAQTAMGPRVTLARSDVVADGAVIECQLAVLGGPVGEKHLRRILDYGEFQGLGQWRNADWGRFSYELTKVE